MNSNLYQEYTKKLYDYVLLNEQIPKFSFNKESQDDKLPWLLLGCDMVLKNNNLEMKVYHIILIFVAELLQDFDYHSLTKDHWSILTGIARKLIKRLGSKCEIESEFHGIINVIRLNVEKIEQDQVLKLLLACKDFGINLKFENETEILDFEIFKDHLYTNYKSPVKNEEDVEEFYFIKTDVYELTYRRRIHRLLFFLDPIRVIKNCSASFEYWFELFSVSDKELIRFMIDLLICDQVEFAKLYVFIIVEDKLSVDFFVDKLIMEDSSQILKLILLMTQNLSESKALKILKSNKDVCDVINFHTLLLLKLEAIKNNCICMTPVDYQTLTKNIESFLNKLKFKMKN